MSKSIRGIASALGVFALSLPLCGLAMNYPPPAYNLGYQAPPPGGYNYRPQPPNNARGAPPGYQTAGPYGYGQPQQAQSQLKPRLELQLYDNKPYVQENTLLALRVISGSNLSTIDPLLPQNQSVTFHKLKGPSAFTRMVGGQRQIVNEMIYMVTPLREGNIELPIGAEIQFAGNGYAGNQLDLESARPLRIEARPARADVQPWLPLEQLALTSNIDVPVNVEPGKPISLVLKLAAVGATGSQLPSLERLLQSADFRVYREKSATEGGLSKNARHIMGTRTEHYTLVPQYGGKLRLPSARISWFNVSTGTVEHTSLPIKTLEAKGRAAGLDRFFGQSDDGSLFPAGYASAFWLPLSGIFLLLTGYWIGVWYKGRETRETRQQRPSVLSPLKAAADSTLAGARRRTGHALAKLNPRRHWNRTIGRAANRLPTSLRLWFWVRCANDEKDPGLWCKTLQFMSCRQLAISPYATRPQMAEKVIQYQPRADPGRVRELFHQLDGAIYGHQAIDFNRWKRQFQKQVRPRLLGQRTAGDESRNTHKLPELNPKTA